MVASGISDRRRIDGVGRLAGSASSVASARLLEQPQQQRDRQRRRREGDDDAGDDHRLRHGSPAKPAAAPRARDDAEHRKTPLPSRLKARILRSGCGLNDQAVQAEADQRGAAQPEQRGRRSSSAAPVGRTGHQQRQRRRDRERHRRPRSSRISGLAKPRDRPGSRPATTKPSKADREEQRRRPRPAPAAASGRLIGGASARPAIIDQQPHRGQDCRRPGRRRRARRRRPRRCGCRRGCRAAAAAGRAKASAPSGSARCAAGPGTPPQ